MNRYIFCLVMLLLVCKCAFSQDIIAVQVYQDARLLVLGDDKGNSALTPNIMARVELQGKQLSSYYFSVFPEFEYAAIDGEYKRYSVNLGWTFNKWVKNTEFNATVGFGWIDRWRGAFFSSGGSLGVYYGKRLKGGLVMQFTERKDLGFRYNDNALRMSGFVGLKYDLF